jgi:hypothetical protein
MQRRIVGRFVNDELGRMRKEAIVSCFTSSTYFLGKTKENHDNLSKYVRPRGRDLNLGSSNMKEGSSHSTAVLGKCLWRFVHYFKTLRQQKRLS